jgi:glutamine amidotransferase
MSNTIAIVDYGMGNLFSIQKKLHRLNITPTITSDPQEIRNAKKIILPGVGHFCKAMEQIDQLGLFDVLNHAVLVDKKPILGICLGMQLMANRSEGGNCSGFGWFNAEVVRFRIQETAKFKVPHMGWNTITHEKKSPLLDGISEGSEFYFVHSYHVVAHHSGDVLCKTQYEQEFCSALERENVFGVQFHPEKSHDMGQRMLKNFVDLP